MGLLLVVALFMFANARAARMVSERWEIDDDPPWPRVWLVVAIDAAILIAIGIVSSWWAALALVPIVAILVMVSVRRHPSGRGDRQLSSG